MVIAFMAVAAGEVFTRKNWPILALPMKRRAILLAFVPVLFFRLTMFTELFWGLTGPIPGLTPFLDYLERMARNYAMEALSWLLLGVFFGWLAQLRLSANFGIVAARAVNVGLWG